jgi:hypothetical protein
MVADYLDAAVKGGTTAAPAVVEFLDASRSTTDFVTFGLWDGAFDASGALLDDPTKSESDVFVGADSRRFHIRVADKALAGKGRVSVEWWTEKPGATAPLPVDMPTRRSVVCPESPAGSGTFVSPALMLVTDDFDLDHAATPSGLGDGARRNRGEDGYRLRRGSMFGHVMARYTGAAGAQASVFRRSPDDRRQLPLQIFALRGLESSGVLNLIWNVDLPYIRLAYERVGLWAWTVVAGASPSTDRRTGGLNDTVTLIDPPAGFTTGSGLTRAQAEQLATAHPGLSSVGAAPPSSDTIRVFYVGQLDPKSDNGVYYGDVGVLAGAVWIANANTGAGTSSAAHEIGHALGLPHFAAPTPPLRFRPQQNLMVAKADPKTFGTIAYPGRLWQILGVPSNQSQYDAIRSSRFVRA